MAFKETINIDTLDRLTKKIIRNNYFDETLLDEDLYVILTLEYLISISMSIELTLACEVRIDLLQIGLLYVD